MCLKSSAVSEILSGLVLRVVSAASARRLSLTARKAPENSTSSWLHGLSGIRDDRQHNLSNLHPKT